MNMKNMLIGGIVVLAMAANVASADIVVQNTGYNIIGPTGSTTQTISGFALSGGTKLVVTTGTENGNATGITFAGQALTSIVGASDSPQFASIWYLDNPAAVSGDIVVTYINGGNLCAGMSALSISGAELGVLGSAGAKGSNSGTLTINAGSMVVGSFATNAGGTLINPNDPSTDIFSEAIWGASGGNAAAAYFIEPDPAARTSFGFTGGTTSRPVAAAASFAAAVIPEPATLSMIGMIGIAMLVRRRIVR